MAGHGRKPSMSLSSSIEQLRISKEEMLSASLLQPSPSYPPLDHKPLPIQMTTEMSYLVELKRDFTEYMRESPNYVQTIVLNEDIERFCEDYDETIMTNTSEYESMHDWSKMPMELQLSRKRKLSDQQQSAQPSKKQKIIDIAQKLAELEKKENAQEASAEKKIKQEGEEEEEDESEEKEGEHVKDENEMDEEMDDGTDYANEYFENGDNYYSEDDNDDGPTYF